MGDRLGQVDPLFSGVGSGTNDGQFHQHGLRRQRGDADPERQRAVLRHVQPAACRCSAFAGPGRPGDLDAGHRNNSTTSGATGTLNSWSLSFPEAAADHGPGRAGQRQHQRQLPHLHPGPDRRAVEPGLDGGRPGVDRRRWRHRSGDESPTGGSGRVTGLAIDPSDPSGNTVYAAGASGGVWKTTNFLTTNPGGPTWIPLTDFGPTNAVNIGSIAVFARNNDPNQSIIIAATGEGDTGTPGVGFLISDGRRRDLEPLRQHRQRRFQRQPAADRLAGARPRVRRHDVLQGRRRSQAHAHRPGDHLRRLERHQRRHLAERGHGQDLAATMLAGQATDVVLDPDSGTVLNPDTDTTVQGNLQVVYAAIRGVGVFMSPNQGQVWNLMPGGIGNPLIFNDFLTGRPNVNPVTGPTPNGAKGGSSWPCPARPATPPRTPSTRAGSTRPSPPPPAPSSGSSSPRTSARTGPRSASPPCRPVSTDVNQAIPTNDVSQPDYPIIGGRPSSPPGQLQPHPGRRPDRSQRRLPGRHRSDGGQTGLIRVDTDHTSGTPTPWSPIDNFANDGGGAGPRPPPARPRSTDSVQQPVSGTPLRCPGRPQLRI